jgi:hypothetical protein
VFSIFTKPSRLVRPVRTSVATPMILVVALFSGAFLVNDNKNPSPSDAVDAFEIINQVGKTPSEIADLLAADGVELSNVRINGLSDQEMAEFSRSSDVLRSFGQFQNGLDYVGIDQGLAIAANADASSFALQSFTDVVSDNRTFDQSSASGTIGDSLYDLGDQALGARNANNMTELEFTINPDGDFLKFDYVLGITEGGDFENGTWGGAVFGYPDGLGLFVKGAGEQWSPQQNCAVVPTTSTYVTMETSGIIPGNLTDARTLATTNYTNLVAETLIPGNTIDVTRTVSVVSPTPDGSISPPGIAYKNPLPTSTIQFLTVPLTCVVDVSAFTGPLEVGIAVADFNDGAVPPIVFLQGNSVRFSSTSAPVSAALDLGNELEPGNTDNQASGPPSTKIEIVGTVPQVFSKPDQRVSVFGTNFDRVLEIWVGDQRVKILEEAEYQRSFKLPANLKPKVRVFFVTLLERIEITDSLRFAGALAVSSDEFSVRGFEPNVPLLSSRMKKQVKEALAEEPNAKSVICTGYTSLPFGPRDQQLATQRGAELCKFIKSIRPEVLVTVNKGVQDPRPGPLIRRAGFVLQGMD